MSPMACTVGVSAALRSGRCPRARHSPGAHPPGPSVEPVIGRVRRAVAVALLALALAGCATFPDDSPRDWRRRSRTPASWAAPRCVPEPGARRARRRAGAGRRPSASPSRRAAPTPIPRWSPPASRRSARSRCCPTARTALVAERTGRVLRVQHGVDPVLVTTVPVDATGGGGLTGLVLSPALRRGPARLRLHHHADRQPRGPARPGRAARSRCSSGIPRGARGQRAVRWRPTATGAARRHRRRPGRRRTPRSLAGKLLRIDTLGPPGPDNPDPASPIYSPRPAGARRGVRRRRDRSG